MVNQMQEMPEMILEDPDENSAMISSYVPNPQGTYHQSHYYSTAGPSSHPQRMPHAGYQNVSQPQYYQSRSHHHHHHLSGITQPTMAYDDFQHHPQPLQDQRRIQQNPRGHYPQHRMPQRVYIHSDPSDFRYSHHGQYPQVYQEEIVQTSHDPSLPSYSQQQDSSVYYEQRIPYPIASIQMSRQPINNVVESNIESTNSQGNTFDESVIEESQLQYIVPQAEMFEASASGEDPYLPSVGSTCTIETSSPSPAAQQQMDIYDFSVGDDEMESQMPTSVPSSFAPGISLTTPHLVRQTGPSKDKSLIQQQQFKQVKRKQISSTIPAFEEEDDEEESGSNRLTSPISKMAKSATNSEKVKSPTLKGQQMNINALHIVPVVKRTRKQVFPSNSKETKSSLVPTSSSKILTTKEKEKTGKSLPSVKQKKEESSRTLQVSNNNKQSTSISTQQQMQSVGGSLIARQQAGISPQSITKTRPKVARVKMSKPRNTGLEDGNDIVMAASKSLKDKKKAPISTTSTTSTMAAKITTKLSHQSSSSSSSTLSTTSTSSSMGTKKTDSLQKVKLSSSTVDSMASAVGGAKSKTTGDSAGRRTTSVAQKEDTNTSLIGSILAASAMPPKIQKRTNTIMLSDSFMDALNEQTVKKPKIVRKKVAPTVVTTAASSTTTTTILDGPLYRDTPVTSLASSFSASSSFSSSTIVRPTLNIHRELSDPLDNNPDYLGNKARRRICFADEKGAELTTIRYFELEEGERMNVTKMTSEEMKHMEMHNERIQHEKSGHFKSVTNLPMPQGFGFRQQINCTTLRPWKLIPLEGITELIERGVNSESKLIELRRQNTVMEAFCDPFTPLPMSDIDEVDNQRPDGAMPPKPIPLEPILSPSEEDFMAGGTAITSDGAANDASHITSFTTASSVMPSASSIITQLPLPFSSSSSSSAAWSSSSHQQEQMNQTNFRLSSKLLPPNVAALMSGLSPNVSSLLLDEPHKSLPQNETLSFSSPIQAPSTKTKAPEVEKIVAKAKKEDKEDIDSPQSPVGFAETTNDENIDDILEAMDTTKSPEGPDSPESFVKSPMDEVDNEVIMIDDVDRREKNVEKNNVEDEDKEDTDIRCIPAERMPDDDADEEDVSQMDVDCRMFSGTAVAAATAPSSPTITDMSEFMSKLRSTGIIGGVNWAAGILDKVKNSISGSTPQQEQQQQLKTGDEQLSQQQHSTANALPVQTSGLNPASWMHPSQISPPTGMLPSAAVYPPPMPHNTSSYGTVQPPPGAPTVAMMMARQLVPTLTQSGTPPYRGIRPPFAPHGKFRASGPPSVGGCGRFPPRSGRPPPVGYGFFGSPQVSFFSSPQSAGGQNQQPPPFSGSAGGVTGSYAGLPSLLATTMPTTIQTTAATTQQNVNELKANNGITTTAQPTTLSEHNNKGGLSIASSSSSIQLLSTSSLDVSTTSSNNLSILKSAEHFLPCQSHQQHQFASSHLNSSDSTSFNISLTDVRPPGIGDSPPQLPQNSSLLVEGSNSSGDPASADFDLNALMPIAKTFVKQCTYYLSGSCHYGESCRFAHGNEMTAGLRQALAAVQAGHRPFGRGSGGSYRARAGGQAFAAVHVSTVGGGVELNYDERCGDRGRRYVSPIRHGGGTIGGFDPRRHGRRSRRSRSISISPIRTSSKRRSRSRSPHSSRRHRTSGGSHKDKSDKDRQRRRSGSNSSFGSSSVSSSTSKASVGDAGQAAEFVTGKITEGGTRSTRRHRETSRSRSRSTSSDRQRRHSRSAQRRRQRSRSNTYSDAEDYENRRKGQRQQQQHRSSRSENRCGGDKKAGKEEESRGKVQQQPTVLSREEKEKTTRKNDATAAGGGETDGVENDESDKLASIETVANIVLTDEQEPTSQ